MKKAVLYLAMSLDGYIADEAGGVDWLSGEDAAAEMPDTYARFVATVDTVVMGWNTYHQIRTELSPGRWVYAGLRSYVLTRRSVPSGSQILFTGESPCALVRRLKQGEGKNVWICGGAAIAQQLMGEGLIDIFHISIIPTILGSGIRLFGRLERKTDLKLMAVQDYNGITELVYERRPDAPPSF